MPAWPRSAVRRKAAEMVRRNRASRAVHPRVARAAPVSGWAARFEEQREEIEAVLARPLPHPSNFPLHGENR